MHVAHGGQGVRVAHGATAQMGANGSVIAVPARQDALEVRRIPHVHGVGQGGKAEMGYQFAGVEVARHHVVAVGGRQEAGHRQSPLGGIHAGGQVAEVAAGHAEQGPPAGAKAHAGEEVVERLRQQAAQADGVRRAQACRGHQLRVGQGALHQSLAVVERARHLQGVDVVAERGELLLLQGADAARRIQQHHLDTPASPEGARHGAAGVAGGRDQHHDTLSGGARAELTLQQRGQKRGAEVLERTGGAVEQLQQRDAVVQPAQRRGEWEGRFDQGACRGRGPIRRRRELLFEEPGGGGCRHLLERSPVRQGGDLPPQVRRRVGLVEAAAGRQAGQQRGAERQTHAGIARGADLHLLSPWRVLGQPSANTRGPEEPISDT